VNQTKHPVTAKRNEPPCFCLSFQEGGNPCDPCSFRSECEVGTAQLSDTRSLAELLADADSRTGLPSKGLSLQEIYDSLYQRHFGKKSPRRDNDKNRKSFTRLREFLDKNGLDAATFITANMVGMQKWVERNPRVGFQPNHLSGNNAAGRYNAYVRASNRRLHRATADAFDYKTPLGRLRSELYRSEFRTARLFVASHLAGVSCSWDNAAKKAEVTSTWKAVQKIGASYWGLVNRFGKPTLDAEVKRMRISAAASLCEAYQSGLSTRVGFSRFSWEALADLLKRLFPLPQGEAFPTSHLSLGQHWGGA
jgi:hypothetical protein